MPAEVNQSMLRHDSATLDLCGHIRQSFLHRRKCDHGLMNVHRGKLMYISMAIVEVSTIYHERKSYQQSIS